MEAARRIAAKPLRRLVARIFEAAGGGAEEAEAIAGNLVDANLAGHDSHGVIRTERYLVWLSRGILNFDRHAQVVINGEGFALLDGGHGFGQTVGPEAVRFGITQAQSRGAALIGLRRVGHLGRIGAFAEMACAEGLVSVHFVNVGGSVLVAPFGARARRMSTAPVCVGVPYEAGDFILDFATSKVAEGKVLIARKEGRPAPPGALIDADGRPTDDPDALYGPRVEGVVDDPRRGPGALAPMGAHKGSGLALACELLAGALTGSGTATATAADGGDERPRNGMLSLYLRPELLDDGHGWAGEVARYLTEIRCSPPADPAQPVMIPGDPERRTRAERLAHGIPVDAELWESLMRAAEGQGIGRAEAERIALG